MGSKQQKDDDANEIVLPTEPRSHMLERHAEERKQLAKRFERLKASIPRKDRTGRARLTEDQENEERILKNRQTQELAEFPSEDPTDEPQRTDDTHVTHIVGDMDKLSLKSTDGQPRKESKAARRRRVKAEKEAQSEARIAQERANMGTSERQKETQAIEKQLQSNRLTIHPIAPDGHCLYGAIAHQMQASGKSFVISPTVSELREATANHMLANAEEYIPFIESVEFNRDRFVQYCNDIRTKAVWGGQVELRALAELLDVVIEVYAADMPVVAMQKEQRGIQVATLRVSFHRKYYGLGEHYNSIVLRPPG